MFFSGSHFGEAEGVPLFGRLIVLWPVRFVLVALRINVIWRFDCHFQVWGTCTNIVKSIVGDIFVWPESLIKIVLSVVTISAVFWTSAVFGIYGGGYPRDHREGAFRRFGLHQACIDTFHRFCCGLCTSLDHHGKLCHHLNGSLHLLGCELRFSN